MRKRRGKNKDQGNCKKKIMIEEAKTNEIKVSSLMQSELDKRTNKDENDNTKISNAIEFIGTLMEKEEADSKDSASLATSETWSDSTKSALCRTMGKENNKNRRK